jgi:hypothetical protein
MPCGEFGTYAHYGLLDGLLGFSIGAINQDTRFYLNRLVQMKSEFFKRSILTANEKTGAVYHDFKKFQKDLMKWRWNYAKKHPISGEFSIIPTHCLRHSGLYHHSNIFLCDSPSYLSQSDIFFQNISSYFVNSNLIIHTAELIFQSQ